MKDKPWLRWTSDDQAVSPVIAVILMVAITVVLAAVVYTWASGLAGTGPGSGVTAGTCSQGTSNVIRIDQAPSAGSVDRDDPTFRMAGETDTWTGQNNTDPDANNFNYTWQGAWDDKIGGGDRITIQGAPTGGVWEANDRFTFEAIFRGETILSCPFTWQG